MFLLVQAFSVLVLLACWHGGVSAKQKMNNGLHVATRMVASVNPVVDVGDSCRGVHVDRLADSENGLQVFRTRQVGG